MMTLTNQQIKQLRKLAHHEKPLFQMGKQGLSHNFIQQINEALEKRELIKFHVLQNSSESVKEVATLIADQVGADVVQTIGSTAILYRQSSQANHQMISSQLS